MRLWLAGGGVRQHSSQGDWPQQQGGSRKLSNAWTAQQASLSVCELMLRCQQAARSSGAASAGCHSSELLVCGSVCNVRDSMLARAGGCHVSWLERSRTREHTLHCTVHSSLRLSYTWCSCLSADRVAAAGVLAEPDSTASISSLHLQAQAGVLTHRRRHSASCCSDDLRHSALLQHASAVGPHASC